MMLRTQRLVVAISALTQMNMRIGGAVDEEKQADTAAGARAARAEVCRRELEQFMGAIGVLRRIQKLAGDLWVKHGVPVPAYATRVILKETEANASIVRRLTEELAEQQQVKQVRLTIVSRSPSQVIIICALYCSSC